MQEFKCSKCMSTDGGLKMAKAPFGGKFGQELQEKVCVNCWNEWSKKMQLMVINEYRLNMMDPGDRDRLTGFMRQFLGLDAGDAPKVEYVPEKH